MSASNRSKVLGYSVLGGILGAIVMSVILVASKIMMGLPPMADFMVMGTFAGGQGDAAIAVGWVAHFVTGIIVGLVFGLITSSVGKLHVTNVGRGVVLGAAYGFVVYIVLFLPLLVLGFGPIMVAMMGPAAMAMAPIVMGIGLVEHLLYGGVLGSTVGLGSK